MSEKTVTVLARNDHREAMRVAAGITIYEHQVNLVFLHHVVSEEEADSEEAELLELVEIAPLTTVEDMQEHLKLISSAELAALLDQSSFVVNV